MDDTATHSEVRSVFRTAAKIADPVLKYGFSGWSAWSASKDFAEDVSKGHVIDGIISNAYVFPDAMVLAGGAATLTGIPGAARIAAGATSISTIGWTAGIAAVADGVHSAAYHLGWTERPGVIESWAANQANLDGAYKALFPHDTSRSDQAAMRRDAKSVETISPGQYRMTTETFVERGGSIHSEAILDEQESNAAVHSLRFFPGFTGDFPPSRNPDNAKATYNTLASTLKDAPESERAQIFKDYIMQSVIDNARGIAQERNLNISKYDLIPDDLMTEAAKTVFDSMNDSYIYAQLHHLDPRFINDRNLQASAAEFLKREHEMASSGQPFSWENQEQIQAMRSHIEQKIGPELSEVRHNRAFAMPSNAPSP